MEAAYLAAQPDDPTSSWSGILQWAIKQASTSDPDEVRAGVQSRLGGTVDLPGSTNLRPVIYVDNPADLQDDLRVRLGTGPTSGIFLRAGRLVHVPQINEVGYVPRRDDGDDGAAQVREVTRNWLAGRLDYAYECVKSAPTKGNPDGVEHAMAPVIVCTRLVEVAETLPAVRVLAGSSTHPCCGRT